MDADPESRPLLAQILLLIVLTLINAFLAVPEIAVVSINKNRIEQKADEGDVKSQKLLEILQNPDNFLSTIQIGTALVNILSGTSLANTLSERLTPVLGGGVAARNIANITVLAILTYVSIVSGGLYPKHTALNKSEEVARFTSGLIRLIDVMAKPFVWLLSASTSLLARITSVAFDDEDSKMTRNEIRYMLENEGVLGNEGSEMLQGVFSLDTKVARKVMVLRAGAFMTDVNDTMEENVSEVLSGSYSRIPVYNKDKDKVVGILHTKNLLKAAHKFDFDSLDIKRIMQEPLFIPETTFIDDLLYEMKETQNQMAISLGEYGDIVGLAILEDLLEGVVREIDGESDEVENLYEKIDEHEYIIQGHMLIDEFSEAFGSDLHMSDVDTMVSYLITVLGMIPGEGEKLSFDIDSITLVSEEMGGSRILKIRVTFHDLEEAEAGPGEERRYFRKEFEDNEPRR